MSRDTNSRQTVRSNSELAQMIVHIAQVAQFDAILCATETGALARCLHVDASDRCRINAATTDKETFDALIKADLEAVRLPLRAADPCGQIRHVISVALRSAKV
jgi:pyruvate kinase